MTDHELIDLTKSDSDSEHLWSVSIYKLVTCCSFLSSDERVVRWQTIMAVYNLNKRAALAMKGICICNGSASLLEFLVSYFNMPS